MDNIYKLEKIVMIKSSDGPNIVNLSANGVKRILTEIYTMKCIIIGRNGLIKGLSEVLMCIL